MSNVHSVFSELWSMGAADATVTPSPVSTVSYGHTGRGGGSRKEVVKLRFGIIKTKSVGSIGFRRK